MGEDADLRVEFLEAGGDERRRARMQPVLGADAPLRLAVNRLGEKGKWDLDELKVELEELILAENLTYARSAREFEAYAADASEFDDHNCEIA